MDNYKPAVREVDAADSLSVQQQQQIVSQQQMIVQALHEVVGWLSGRTTKTEVINQIESIATPDVDKVVAAVNKLDKTMGANKLDTSGLEKTLSKLDTVTVTNLGELGKHIIAVEKAVKAIKLTPLIDVQVPEQTVTVQPADLEPLKLAMGEVVQAVKDIEYPEAPEETLSGFVTEQYDEYHIEYDPFSDGKDERPIATHYFLNGDEVATVEFSYNSLGNLVGAKKV